jgi:glycosyltransferase involved in cell wall biosynthesis
MTIKILHLITDLNTGGAETSLFRLLSNMDNEMFDNQVVSLIPVGRVGEKIRELGIKVHSLDMRPGRPTFSALVRLTAWLQREKPDILQTWLYHADLLGIMAGSIAKIPIVIWNIRNSNIDYSQYRRLSGFVVQVCSWLSRWPKAVVSNSYAGRDFHIRLGYNPRRWKIIPNGIDTQVFRPDCEAYYSLRQELGLAPDTPLIGQVARYDPMKNHKGFLMAAGDLARSDSRVHFIMVGQGVSNDNTALLEIINQEGLAGRVHMLGRRDDMPRLNAALDILTSASSFGEGFPNAVAEAMACEVLSVVTDVGDAALIVGETGRIVPPRDPEALAKAWSEILSLSPSERQSLGLIARQRIIDHYSLDKMVSAYCRLYQDIIEELK